jgi:hypothetical protein
MKTKQRIRSGVTAVAVVIAVSGCGVGNGNSTSTKVAGGSQATTQSNLAGRGGNSHRGNFQPTIDMKVNPTSPTAGKAFTVTFEIQRPSGGQRHQGSFGAHTGNSTGTPSGGLSGNQNGIGGQYGAGHSAHATAVLSGGGVNQTLNLTSQNGSFKGSLTLAKAGTYQVDFTMNFGPRQIKKQYTLKVN